MRQNKGGGRLGKESHFRLLFDCAAMMRRGEENAADEVDSVIDKLVAMRGKRPGTLCTALTGEKELRIKVIRARNNYDLHLLDRGGLPNGLQEGP